MSQISSKTDLTKISLPSVLCHPFSMLELISHRELLLFHILFELDGVNDPLQRFIIVVKWYIALLRTETMEKKPFNPVIGETHLCWVANTNSDSITEFISEQVSHHPPVSAFLIRNKDKNLRIEGAVSFGVHLATNSASVSTSSAVLMTTDKDSYELSKCVPDLTVCNTIMPGKKYIMWTGEVKLVCPETGYYAVLKTEEKSGKVNQIIGQILHRDEPKPIYKLEGVCGKITQYWPANSPKEKKVLLDHSQLQEAFINYLPRHLRSSLDSMKLWVPVVDAILKNDMATADIEKKKIEADQRIRQAKKFEDGLGSEGTYFMKNPVSGNWEFKDNMDLTEFMNLGKPADVLGLPPSEPINVPAPLTIEPVAASPSLSVSPIDVPIPQSAPVLVEPEKEPLPVTAAVKTDIPPTVTSTNTTTPISANPPSPQVTPNVPTNVPTVPAVDQEVKVTPEIDATTTNNLTNTTNPPVANIANNTQPQPQPQRQQVQRQTQLPEEFWGLVLQVEVYLLPLRLLRLPVNMPGARNNTLTLQ
uniref:Oxysterol-binding protein n=1 Tax=Arcella intermedia TaxID=1963864 RepID=A0A6B2L1I0_9EUKA